MNVPASWREARLGALCRAMGGGTPSRGNAAYWNGSVPWASVKDFSEDSIYLRDTEERISEEGLLNSASNLIPANTPLVCTRMAVGRCALSGMPIAINQDVKALLDLSGIEPKFLVRVIALRGHELNRIAIGSTVKGINTEQLLALSLHLPSIDEQVRISVVLDTFDAAIEQTKALLAKLKQLRAGLLLDLLTPTKKRSQEWSVVRLGDVCEHITKGATPTTFGFKWVEQGVLFLRSECVTEDGTSMVGSQQISPQAHAVMARSAVHGGDLLMTITGYIGRVCQYPIDWPGANINQHIARIRIRDVEKLVPEFALWALKHPHVTRALELEVTGLAYPQIGLAQVQNIFLKAPDVECQREIAATLDAQHAEVKACEAQLEKLQAIKRGLSDDLLTGCVRIPAELELA